MTNVIKEFKGEHRFLSNFYCSRITYAKVSYPSVEHAYQAAKCDSLDDKIAISKITHPKDAKQIGKNLVLPHDWDWKRLIVMKECLELKFARKSVLSIQLLNTKDALLIEGNWWKDDFWGFCFQTNSGSNELGKLLMARRNELRGLPFEQ